MWPRCHLSAFQCSTKIYRSDTANCVKSWHRQVRLIDNCTFTRFCSSLGSQNRPSHALVTHQKSYAFNRLVRLSSSPLSNAAKSFISFGGGTSLNKYLRSLVEKHAKTLQELAAIVNLAHQSNVDCESSRSSKARIEALKKTMNEIEPIATLFTQHQQHLEEIEQLEDILKESSGIDEDLCQMARSDVHTLQNQILVIESEIVDLLVPPSFGDQNDIILEVSAGVGGQEAMLFTKDLFEMYKRYADFKGWTIDIVNFEVSDLGGVRHAMACISGRNVFMRMKYEGGVHRVQRVPQTEKSGRVHTSTATVAVMARPNEVDVVLNAKDLRIETCRASGKGGQHVNTTDSAVRIVHLPTGTTAECQSERSQIRNKETALKVLRTRLYEKEMEVKMKEQTTARKIQVGSAGRSEKIRTYNAKDDRVTDHRVAENVYGVESLFEGGGKLDELIDMLEVEWRRERLLEVVNCKPH